MQFEKELICDLENTLGGAQASLLQAPRWGGVRGGLRQQSRSQLRGNGWIASILDAIIFVVLLNVRLGVWGALSWARKQRTLSNKEGRGFFVHTVLPTTQR